MQFGDIPRIPDWKIVYDSGGMWRLYHHKGKWAITRHSSTYPKESYQTTILNEDFTKGTIFNNENVLYKENKLLPFYYPLPEIITILLLSRERGVLLHASAIDDKGHGLIFSGPSGAGKSTLAQIWKKHPGVVLLSDDRAILRKGTTGYRLYGTPWHGDAKIISPESVSLSQIFIIQHANNNYAFPIKPIDAVSRLLTQSFSPYWNSQGMAYTLNFLSQVSQSIPVYELGFKPNASVVEFIHKLVNIP